MIVIKPEQKSLRYETKSMFDFYGNKIKSCSIFYSYKGPLKGCAIVKGLFKSSIIYLSRVGIYISVWNTCFYPSWKRGPYGVSCTYSRAKLSPKNLYNF